MRHQIIKRATNLFCKTQIQPRTENNESKMVIRDDDICYHTNSEELQSIYHEINKICPVFSCIPDLMLKFYIRKMGQFDEQWLEWQTEEFFP